MPQLCAELPTYTFIEQTTPTYSISEKTRGITFPQNNTYNGCGTNCFYVVFFVIVLLFIFQCIVYIFLLCFFLLQDFNYYSFYLCYVKQNKLVEPLMSENAECSNQQIQQKFLIKQNCCLQFGANFFLLLLRF